MELSFTHESLAPIDSVFVELLDLGKYQHWMPLVRSAEPDLGNGQAATWTVILTGSVGKLRRSKRLRMVRVEAVQAETIVFERAEIDGRAHSRWRLSVSLEAISEGTSVDVMLRYDGGLWEPLVERMLRGEIDEARARLEQRLSTLIEE